MLVWIQKSKSKRWFKWFYWFTKCAMAFGMLGSGIRKLPEVKFTQIPIENPIGMFFEGMYQTGFYWNFIGYFQLALAVLLIPERFAPLASVLMMPIVFNIWLVSASLHMTGTPMITSLMLLANVFLILWHWNNVKGVLQRPK